MPAIFEIWQVLKYLREICQDGELEYRHQLTDHSLGVVSVAVSGDGKRVASSSLDSVIIVWDTLTGAKIATMETGPVDAWSVIFTHDDKFIVSGKQKCGNESDSYGDILQCSLKRLGTS